MTTQFPLFSESKDENQKKFELFQDLLFFCKYNKSDEFKKLYLSSIPYFTHLHEHQKHKLVTQAIECKHLDIIKTMCELNIDLNHSRFIHSAIKEGIETLPIIQFFQSHYPELFRLDLIENKNFLYYSLSSKHLELADYFISQHYDINNIDFSRIFDFITNIKDIDILKKEVNMAIYIYEHLNPEQQEIFRIIAETKPCPSLKEMMNHYFLVLLRIQLDDELIEREQTGKSKL